jgi:hypothetical protein
MNLVSACGDCCEALSGIRIWVFLPGRTWDFSLRAIKYRPDPTVFEFLCAIASGEVDRASGRGGSLWRYHDCSFSDPRPVCCCGG